MVHKTVRRQRVIPLSTFHTLLAYKGQIAASIILFTLDRRDVWDAWGDHVRRCDPMNTTFNAWLEEKWYVKPCNVKE